VHLERVITNVSGPQMELGVLLERGEVQTGQLLVLVHS
jgi:hypothetical protein